MRIRRTKSLAELRKAARVKLQNDWRRRQLERDWKLLAERINPDGVEKHRGSVKRYLREWRRWQKSSRAFARRLQELGVEHPMTRILQREEEPPTYGSYVECELDVFGDASPIVAFFHLVDRGHYPPPDVLLALEAEWNEYLVSDGSLSLEECFLGKPVRRGGNFARRWAAQRKHGLIAFELGELVESRDLTIEEAAEEFVRLNECGLDVESVAKIARQFRWPRLRMIMEHRQQQRKIKRRIRPR